ncbi:MAG: DUF2911 domain-containing protein [Bacteroidota bacterium]|nr:DUF2911 domain-containing protein [Bacteroidota bacterium]
MQLKYLLLTLLLHLFLLVQAQMQHKNNGYLIYTLGKDTTAIGNYKLKGNDFSMTIVVRTPSTNVNKLKGTFFPNGELQYAEGYNYKPLPGKDSLLVFTSKLHYERDTTFIEQKRGDVVTSQKYPGKAMLANSLGGYTLVFMPALLANFAPRKKGDSVISKHIVLGSARKFVIKRINKRTLTTGSSVMGTFTLFLNKKGKLKSVDGIGSSWNIKGTAVPYLNMDSVIAANLTKEQLNPPVGIINKLDSVQTTIQTTEIKIKYSRPSVRGRVIFGEVVPWNRFWRTGANAATKISLNQPIYFGGKELPPGEYSIFTMPSQNGWTMMFNKESNIWGTDYNADNDVLRIPILIEHLQEPVELLTIEVVPADKAGVINIIWEKLKASVSFTTKD